MSLSLQGVLPSTTILCYCTTYFLIPSARRDSDGWVYVTSFIRLQGVNGTAANGEPGHSHSACCRLHRIPLVAVCCSAFSNTDRTRNPVRCLLTGSSRLFQLAAALATHIDVESAFKDSLLHPLTDSFTS